MTQQAITGDINVWYTSSRWTPLSDVKAKSTDEVVRELHYSNADMNNVEDWVKVGKATVTITFDDEAEVKAQQITSLNSRLQAVRAENHYREKLITDQIANLLALTLSPTTKEI